MPDLYLAGMSVAFVGLVSVSNTTEKLCSERKTFSIPTDGFDMAAPAAPKLYQP